MFQIDDNAEQLKKRQSEIFHSTVAKLLFISKRARPDIEQTVAFLCTRVTKSDVHDWKKLSRLLSYIQNTIDDKQIIGASSIYNLYTWIDAAYAVYEDMKGQTGGCMSMGYGVIHVRSLKQKLNTKSSTKTEIVGMSEYIPYNIWLSMFLKEQGYDLMDNVVFQDNQSAIRMEINGRNSCTGNSRHIHIRYFFVKDRIDKKEMRVEYCPTEHMLADYFTKPSQGARFKNYRDYIMGYKPISELLRSTFSSMKERVENMNQTKKESHNTNVVTTIN